MASAVAAALDRYGRLDVVIDNAGFAAIGVTEAYTAEQFHQMFDVNVQGVVRINRAVLPAMRQQKLPNVCSGCFSPRSVLRIHRGS